MRLLCSFAVWCQDWPVLLLPFQRTFAFFGLEFARFKQCLQLYNKNKYNIDTSRPYILGELSMCGIYAAWFCYFVCLAWAHWAAGSAFSFYSLIAADARTEASFSRTCVRSSCAAAILASTLRIFRTCSARHSTCPLSCFTWPCFSMHHTHVKRSKARQCLQTSCSSRQCSMLC